MSILFNTAKSDEILEEMIRGDAQIERITPTQKLRQIIFKHYEADPRIEKNRTEPAAVGTVEGA
jgi:hypothetical protein